MFIFRASMTVNGVKIYARDYGKRAFKIWIDKKVISNKPEYYLLWLLFLYKDKKIRGRITAPYHFHDFMKKSHFFVSTATLPLLVTSYPIASATSRILI